jgi:hypothetical protein
MSAGLFGTVPAVVLGGLGTLTVVGLWMKLFPALRRVDRFTEVGVKAIPAQTPVAPKTTGPLTSQAT